MRMRMRLRAHFSIALGRVQNAIERVERLRLEMYARVRVRIRIRVCLREPPHRSRRARLKRVCACGCGCGSGCALSEKTARSTCSSGSSRPRVRARARDEFVFAHCRCCCHRRTRVCACACVGVCVVVGRELPGGRHRHAEHQLLPGRRRIGQRQRERVVTNRGHQRIGGTKRRPFAQQAAPLRTDGTLRTDARRGFARRVLENENAVRTLWTHHTIPVIRVPASTPDTRQQHGDF